MESTTIDAVDGGVTDGTNVAHSSPCPPAVDNDMAGVSSAKHSSPESYTLGSDHGFGGSIPGTCDAADNFVKLEAPELNSPAYGLHPHQAPEDNRHNHAVLDGHMAGKVNPDLFVGVGVGDGNDQGKPETYMAVDDVGGKYAAGDARPDATDVTFRYTPQDKQPLKNEDSDAVVLHEKPSPNDTVLDHMHKFTRFPAEIRLMIWEMAIADVEDHRRRSSIDIAQRFRFNLAYDARRVKPGQDKSRGWVACFTPLRINTNPRFVFLRASAESRAILFRNMSLLTVHELPAGPDGRRRAAPRRCHVPFDFSRDDFCVEGVTHALEEARRGDNKDDKDAVWDPEALPLADLLDNALGLRFAPRIKRLAIIPHPVDVQRSRGPFMETTSGRNMAALAKRFPALVTVKTAVLQQKRTFGWDRAPPQLPYVVWKAASLRGKGQGGPSGMSEEDRDALYVTAWKRIFDRQFACLHRDLDPDLFDNCGCLL